MIRPELAQAIQQLEDLTAELEAKQQAHQTADAAASAAQQALALALDQSATALAAQHAAIAELKQLIDRLYLGTEAVS